MALTDSYILFHFLFPGQKKKRGQMKMKIHLPTTGVQSPWLKLAMTSPCAKAKGPWGTGPEEWEKSQQSHQRRNLFCTPPKKTESWKTRRNTLCLDVTAFRETHAHKVPKWGNRRSIQKIRSFQLNLTKNSPTKRICFCQMHAVHSGT